jgi:hypothetical protein
VPDPANRLPFPEVMEFRVSPRRVDDPFTLPRRLSSFRRLAYDRLPPGHMERLVALVEDDGMLTLRELDEVATCARVGTLSEPSSITMRSPSSLYVSCAALSLASLYHRKLLTVDEKDKRLTAGAAGPAALRALHPVERAVFDACCFRISGLWS